MEEEHRECKSIDLVNKEINKISIKKEMFGYAPGSIEKKKKTIKIQLVTPTPQ